MNPRTPFVTGVLLAICVGASSARAYPVTPVSLEWLVEGSTVAAAATTFCADSPGCEAQSACNLEPPNFLVGGDTLVESLSETFESKKNCVAGCTCCVEGSSGSGHAQAQVTITSSSTETSATWFLGGVLSSSASAAYPESQPECVAGVGSGSAATVQSWSLVFDTGGVNLALARTHIVSVIGSDSQATSRIELLGPDGTIFTQDLTRSEQGATDGSGTLDTLLAEGTYTLTIHSEVISAAAAPPNGSGGSAQVDARVNLNFSPDPASVGNGYEPTSDGIHLAAAVPDPFSEWTSLRFSLDATAHVRLTIFDVTGARVVTLLDREQSAGTHSVWWEGRGESGALVSSGIYFASLESRGQIRTRRITVSR